MLSSSEKCTSGAVDVPYAASVEVMKRILLASSSPSLLERNHNLLKRRGVHIQTVSTGREALEYHRDHSLDLILADMQLGDMAGDLLCSEVRNRDGRKVPVVLICRDHPADKARLEGSSADAVICRPIVPLQLMETVGRFLDMEMVRRRRVDLETEVTVLNKGDGTECSCVSRDISSSGMRLEGERPLPTGTSIVCRFALPCAYRIEVDGLVVRRVETPDGRLQYGVLFLDLSHASSCQIESLVAASAA